MIKRLKFKFIIINVFSVLLVMFIAFFCNYSFNKANMYSESLRVMEASIKEGSPKNIHTYLVYINNYNNIYQVRGYNGSLNSDFNEVSVIATAALNSDVNVGDIYNSDLRFMKSSTPNGTVIAFTSTIDEHLALEGIVRFSTYIFVCCSIVFICVSVYLANIATAPVEESIEKRKQFIADASHELKTPLTAITTSAELLLDSSDVSKDDKTWVRSIKDSADDMSVLVNDMLNLARLENEIAKRTEENVNLSELATNIVLDYEYIFFEADKQLTSDVDEGIVVFGNGNELKQLMKIFLDNAKKYSFDGTEIVLSLKYIQERAVFTVFNYGVPIPKNEIDKIFERFYRVDKARSSASGYGLGLAIAKNIAENHSSKINVVSNEEGTSFSVAFKTVKK